MKSKIGISSFTDDTEEKAIIRPMLVTYGMTMRKINPGYWIDRVSKIIQANIKNGKASIVTDVRFSNEVDYIKSLSNSCVIHIRRSTPSNELIMPANDEEAENDPIVMGKSDFVLLWPTFGIDQNDYRLFVQDKFLKLA